MVTSHEEQPTTHHPTFMQYVLVAAILFAITIVEFVLIYDKAGIEDHLGASKIPLLVILSAIKFAIVIMFYMHLKFESRLFTYIFLAGLGLAFAVGISVLGIFVALGGGPRDFAEANAEPYVEEGHEPAGGETPESKADEAVGPIDLEVGVRGDTLEFDTNSFTATAGSEVVLTFSNDSALFQHNWVLVRSGTKDEVAAAGISAGAENDWIPPNDERVVANTKLLGSAETEEIKFTLDAGTYQFVCTFPGHNTTMFGDFEVTEGTSAEGVKSAEAAAVSESTEDGGANSLQVSVQGDALEFDTSSLTATAGSEVVLTFSNGSTLFQHNWVLVQSGTKDEVATAGVAAGPDNDWVPSDDRVLAHTKLLGSGETEELRLTLDAGTYQFVCTFPGHNITMFGDFEVAAGG